MGFFFFVLVVRRIGSVAVARLRLGFRIGEGVVIVAAVLVLTPNFGTAGGLAVGRRSRGSGRGR